MGAALAKDRLQAVHRTYQRTATLSASSGQGWSEWFVGGFSGIAMGFRWLSIIAASLAWTLAGVGLIGLGVQLLSHF